MKILFVTDLYPVNKNEKTTPRTLANFVEGFEQEGVKVDVIKPNFILNSFVRQKPFYKTGKYEKVLNLNYWTPFLGKVENKFSLSKDLPDCIVAHMPSGSIFAHKLSKLFNRPMVCGVHISDIEVLTKPLYKIYFKNALLSAFRHAKLLACRSFIIEKKLLELYPEFKGKTFVAASGIDKNIIVNRCEENFSSEKIKVLTCANLKKRKNIDKVILACKGLESFELTVIGDGKELKNLERLSNNVKFLGHLPHIEVLEKMRESHIFILPSIGETFGMVYLEAMASGCITIGTKLDGIDGIVKNGENGYLVTPMIDNIRSILLNIKCTNNETLKRLRCNSFNTIQFYTDTAMCKHYLQQISNIL